MSKGQVTARGGLNLRQSPKTGKVMRTLRKGSNVEILEEETWLKVRSGDGKIGYVLADHIEKVETNLVNNSNQAATSAVTNLITLANQEQDGFDMKLYTNTQFIGKEMRVDADFIPHLDRLNKYAQECEVNIYITSSTREPGRTVSGNIVKPATHSNHLVGHAIDMNLQSRSGFFNSKKLKRSNFSKLPAEIKKMFALIKSDEVLRWGGEFRQEDPVHIDDNLYRRNADRWQTKLASR